MEHPGRTRWPYASPSRTSTTPPRAQCTSRSACSALLRALPVWPPLPATSVPVQHDHEATWLPCWILRWYSHRSLERIRLRDPVDHSKQQPRLAVRQLADPHSSLGEFVLGGIASTALDQHQTT